MDILAAYQQVGSFRAAAAMCGTTHKTVARVVAAHEAASNAASSGAAAPARKDRGHNYDPVAAVVAEKIDKTKGRITAKRLLPLARAEGYTGSARNFRRLVATAKADWRRGRHRGRRPGVWAAGETLVIDWGVLGGVHVFCAVLAWSRWRFVRFAVDEKATTTLSLLAECFEELGGVPKVVLADRMGCLKGGVVANVVVPTADYVRFATHYGFRPDFCNGQDPESKGIVENLVGYAKSDLMIPQLIGEELSEPAAPNSAARAWCAEVNAAMHSEICAIPADRLEQERPLLGALPSLRLSFERATFRKVDRLSCIRIGSARYSVPTAAIGTQVQVLTGEGKVRVVAPVTGELLAEHALVAPGETSICDEHYGSARPDRPRRAPRARTAAEKEFLALGPIAEEFLTGAAAAGVARLGVELPEITALAKAHGHAPLLAALERAVAFRRWRAADVRSILAAGTGVPVVTPPGADLVLTLPTVPTRSLADYAIVGEGGGSAS
jgi:transposase